MKKVASISAVLVLTYTAFCQQYSPPTAGLVAWWRGEGNGNDSFSNHNGTVQGITFTNGMFGQAFEGGSNRRIYIPDSPDFRLTNFTISAWANIHANSWTLFARMSSIYGAFSFGGNFDGTLRLNINFHDGMTEASLSTPVISYNQWHHVAAVMDSTGHTMSVYVDGSLVAQKSTAVVPAMDLATSGVTGIGLGNALNFDYPELGELDEVLLYERALSASEVYSLFVPFCSPHRATATAQISNGSLTGATITDSGCGYTNPPAVIIKGGGGGGAAASAIVSNGVVSALSIASGGAGYTNAPTIIIGSPPFEPWLGIGVSAVKVTQHVVLGRNYVLESSSNLQTWSQVGAQFTAQSEIITQEFEIDSTGRFFRIREVP